MAQNNLRQSLVYLLLSGIFLIAFLVRVINLANFPVGFHNDEVSIGYSAYSLLQTGRDRNGEILPLSIDQFGDFRPAGYFYLAAVSEKVFGVNEFAVRFPAALFGSLLIFAGYQLAFVLFKNKLIALLFALNVALNPWLIIVSRSSSESIVSLFLGTLGIIFWLTGLENKKITQIVLACIMFTGSFLFYHSARLFVPLFLVSLLVLTFFQTTIKNKKIYLFSLAIILVVLLVIVFLSQGTGRIGQVSIFSTPEVKLSLEEQIREDGGQNVFLTRIYHNKLVNYSIAFFSNFGSYLNIDYLFIKGGLPIRYQIPGTGLLLFTDVVFILLGLYHIFFHKEKKDFRIWLPLLFVGLGIIPAALTFQETPNLQRSLFSSLGFLLVVTLGQYWLWEKVKDKKISERILLVIFALFYFWSIAYFFHQYFAHALTHRPWYRDYGVKELVLNLKQVESNYRKIIMTRKDDNNLPFYLFFNKFPPQTYQDLGSPKDVNYLLFGKYEFVPFECVLEVTKDGQLETETNLRSDYLYVNIGKCPDYPGTKVKNIYRPDNTIVFKIISVPEEIIQSLKSKNQ